MDILKDGFYRRSFTACLVVLAAIIMAYYSTNNFSMNDDCYSFITEWYDHHDGQTKKLKLTFYAVDNSIELFDLRTKKIFLKRVHIPTVKEKDFYVGNTVVVLSRQIHITNYADVSTRQIIDRKRQQTFAMVKSDAIHRVGEIVDLIQNKGFEITEMKMIQLSRRQAMNFYEEHSERSFFEELVDYMTSGPVIPMKLVGSDAVGSWRRLLGPTDSELARLEVPQSVRAQFGSDKQMNAAHGSDSDVSASRELEFFFSKERIEEANDAIALFTNNTCCVIKPHAIDAGHFGKILTSITQEGFRITALKMFRLSKKQAEEFLEVYEDVLPEYPRMVQQLISGPLVALEIVAGEESTPEAFRNFVGPLDPDVAKELMPHSLRARFGESKILNAVHCSDLPDDGPLEVEYFFKILS